MRCVMVLGAALALSGWSWGATVTSAVRTLATNAVVDSGGTVVSDPHEDTYMLSGPREHSLVSNAGHGDSFAFALAHQLSNVSDALVTMSAQADSGGLAAPGDVVHAFAESQMDVYFTLAVGETWRMDAEASGFDNAYAFVELVRDGSSVFLFDSRLGHTGELEVLSLPAGDYYLGVRVSSELDASQVGGLWVLDLAFERLSAPACPGDTNGDLVVDFLDLNIVLSDFGQTVHPGMGGDLNGDGHVDFLDLNIVLSFFGTAC